MRCRIGDAPEFVPYISPPAVTSAELSGDGNRRGLVDCGTGAVARSFGKVLHEFTLLAVSDLEFCGRGTASEERCRAESRRNAEVGKEGEKVHGLSGCGTGASGGVSAMFCAFLLWWAFSLRRGFWL